MIPDRHILLQPAYVLHQRPYRDTSALVELFTPEHGRVGAVAKGVKRPKSPWRGLLQPFRPLLVSWTGGGDLKTLTAVEPQGEPLWLPAQSLASGFYLNELLMRLLQRHDAHVALFGCYDASLRALASATADTLEGVLRGFELNLLEALGYGLILDHEAETGAPIEPDAQYTYHPEQGPLRANGAEHDYGVPISGRSLAALRDNVWQDAQQRREAKQLLRTVLAHYLGPKPLHSRELLMPTNLKKTTHDE